MGLERTKINTIYTPPMPQITLKSEHIGIKYHWFYTWIDRVTVQVKSTASDLQKAVLHSRGSVKEGYK
eukprot:10279873-Ditylum_brightwellii.AAC.1